MFRVGDNGDMVDWLLPYHSKGTILHPIALFIVDQTSVLQTPDVTQNTVWQRSKPWSKPVCVCVCVVCVCVLNLTREGRLRTRPPCPSAQHMDPTCPLLEKPLTMTEVIPCWCGIPNCSNTALPIRQAAVEGYSG